MRTVSRTQHAFESIALRESRRKEGIVPALEPSHALHQTMELAKSLPKDKIVSLGAKKFV